MKTMQSSFFGKLITRVIKAAKAEAAHNAAPDPYPRDIEAIRAEDARVMARTEMAVEKLGKFAKEILGDQYPDPRKGQEIDPSQVRVVVNGTHGCLVCPIEHAENISYNGMLLIPFIADQVVQLAKSPSK
jgi:hypothetical protein